jgi:hypothetical protein
MGERGGKGSMLGNVLVLVFMLVLLEGLGASSLMASTGRENRKSL